MFRMISILLILCSLGFAQADKEALDGTWVGPRGGPTGNDDCATPMAITADGTISLDVSGNTFDAGDPGFSCQLFSTSFQQSTWFTFTPSQNGTISISLCNSTTNTGGTADTLLGIYTGTCGAFTEVACAEDDCGLASEIIGFAVTAGVQYTVCTADWGTTGETATLVLDIYSTEDIFAPDIHTLGQRGMMALLVLLAGAAVVLQRRRRAIV